MPSVPARFKHRVLFGYPPPGGLGLAGIAGAVVVMLLMRRTNRVIDNGPVAAGRQGVEVEIRNAATGLPILSVNASEFPAVRLRDHDLQSANFSGLNLTGADLRGPDLRQALMIATNLRSADLRGANLQQSDPTGARLDDADLRGADLGRAKASRSALHVTLWDESTRWPVRLQRRGHGRPPHSELSPASAPEGDGSEVAP